MGLIAVPVKGKQKSRDLCDAFVAGAPRDAEGFVFYGVDQSNIGVWKTVQKNGQDWWYIDNSYFDSVRGVQFRVTRNAIQLRSPAIYPSTGERFARLALRIKPWQNNADGHWVVCPQSDSFMHEIAEDPGWLNKVRPADGDVRVRPWMRDKLKHQASLQKDLQGARCLITHSSAAAITALIEGIPIVVSSMSAVSGVQYGGYRTQVFNVLADNQFTINEMRQGLAWAMLNRK